MTPKLDILYIFMSEFNCLVEQVILSKNLIFDFMNSFLIKKIPWKINFSFSKTS